VTPLSTVLAVLGGFELGLALGLALGHRRLGFLRADVATLRTLAEDLHSENSRVRLGVLSPRRRQP
jgi:hypothetical protein